MAGYVHFLRCVGKAVVKHGLRSLAGFVPLGDNLYDIACDALADYRRENADEEIRAAVQALALASPAEAKQAADAVVRQVAADQPPGVQQALTAYLAQMPAAVRQSLRRPADPTGTTVPATLALRKPEDLLPFLPQRLPRFKPGDRPLPGVDRELVELLGMGGFGEVWTARNPFQQSAPVVALKFCLDEQAAKALRNEADLLDRVARQGRHPGLVALHQTYLRAVLPCLEYEYVAGGDLTGLVRERHAAGGMRPEEVARLMLQIARAVAFAHGLRPAVVHRDLKPANILVERTAEGALRLKVADFGIGGVVAGRALARSGGRSHTTRQEMTQALRGAHSPLYASPQQVRAAPPDPRDDVYALGVIWYQLLTGDLTTGAPSGMSWVKELTGAGVPRSHVSLMVACFEANPAARPADAADLAKRLGKVLKPTAPPVARPAAAPDPAAADRPRRLPKPAPRRFPVLLAWGATAAFLLCAIVGVAALALSGRDPDTGRRVESPARKTDILSGKSLPPLGTTRTTERSVRPLETGKVKPFPGTNKTEGSLPKAPKPPDPYVNSIGMEFAWIKPGDFHMGSDQFGDEKPVHRVTITKGFYMGVYPVTQKQWQEVMGDNPSNFKGDDSCPVEMVSWEDCQKFCDALKKRDGRPYRLPTEAEWEYACRAGTTTEYYTGDGEDALKKAGWYSGNSDSKTHQVGQKEKNGWGLYDMHGNVWQWCQDWYGPYPKDDVTDYIGSK